MKMNLYLAGCAVAAALYALPILAHAQTPAAGNDAKPTTTAPCNGPCMGGPGAPGGGRMGGHHGMKQDCSQSPNPDYCKSRQEAWKKAAEACKDTRGPDRRQCMQNNMPAPDCSKSPNPERCNAMTQAREACKDKAGPDRRQCVQSKLPPPDCSKSPNPERCTAAQKAREACKDKAIGPDRRQCMRDQFSRK